MKKRYLIIILLCLIISGCGDTEKTKAGISPGDTAMLDAQENSQKLHESIERANEVLRDREDTGYTGKYLSGYTQADIQDEAAEDEPEHHTEEPTEAKDISVATTEKDTSQSAQRKENEIVSSVTKEAENEEPSSSKTSARIPSNTGKYTPVTVNQLYKELNENAMRAENNWNNKYVVISGFLSNIDNDGKYFGLSGSSDSWDLESVHCSMKSDDVKNLIKSQNIGDELVVYGQIDAIGEVMGFTMNVDKVEGNATNSTKASNTTDRTTNGKYKVVTVGDLEQDLKNNAMRAESDWKNQYVQVTGYLSNIDSDGQYFSIADGTDELSWLDGTIYCSMKKNEAVKNKIMNKNMKEKVTVSGKITTVGEVLGIYIDVETVE